MNIKFLKNSVLGVVLLLALALVLTGCQHEALKSEKAKVAPTYRKSGPVEINSSTPKNIAVNVYSTVLLDFKLNSFRERVVVTLQPSQGLSVYGGVEEFSLGITEGNSSEQKEISVLAEAEGLYYLNVFVKTELADTSSVQTAVVPILVGDKAAKTYLQKNGELETDADGRPVVEMPAYEPVRTNESK